MSPQLAVTVREDATESESDSESDGDDEKSLDDIIDEYASKVKA